MNILFNKYQSGENWVEAVPVEIFRELRIFWTATDSYHTLFTHKYMENNSSIFLKKFSTVLGDLKFFDLEDLSMENIQQMKKDKTGY